MLDRLKKISNLSFRSYLVLILTAVFLYLGVFQGRAQTVDNPPLPQRVNISPSSFSLPKTKLKQTWQNPGGALFAELSETADLTEFTAENSLNLEIGDLPAEATSVPVIVQPEVPAVESVTEPATNTEATPEATTTGKLDATETPVEEAKPVEVVPATTDSPTPATAPTTPDTCTAPKDNPLTAPVFAPTPEVAPTPTPEAVPTETKPTSRLNWLMTPAMAEAPVTTDRQLVAKDYEAVYKDFSLPAGSFVASEITNVQLRLSLAAKSSNPDDKLKIYYRTGETWEEAGVLFVNQGLSNKLNNGYYLFGLPIFSAWQDLTKLEVKVVYEQADSEQSCQSAAYVDGLWLEVDYNASQVDKQPPAEQAIGKLKSRLQNLREAELNAPFSLDQVSQKFNFKTSERPDFNFSYRRKQGVVGGLLSKLFGLFTDQYQGVQAHAEFVDQEGKGLGFEPRVNYVSNGEFHVELPDKPRNFRPGKFAVLVTIDDGGNTYTSVKDFSWGVLAINTNKSIYLPTEKAYLQMGVLDDQGDTICDADLYLEVTAPDGGVALLNTDNGLITRNVKCGPNNVIDEPDYFAHYGLAGSGVYQLKLTAKTANGIKEITDQFEVRDQVPFEVERVGPTRIWPMANYQMQLKIKANEAYQGKIVDVMPVGFVIATSSAKLNGQPIDQPLVIGDNYDDLVKGNKFVTWDNVTLQKDDQLELNYEFDAPDISPEFFLLGPLQIGQFTEARPWQIASDMLSVFDANAGTSTVGWVNPTFAWDRTNVTYASTTIFGATTSTSTLKTTANTASSSGGVIRKVELGVKGYVSSTTASVILRPLFNGTATGSSYTIPGTSLGLVDSGNTFYPVLDITGDAAGPGVGNWLWSDVQNLDILANGFGSTTGNKTAWIDQLRIRVTDEYRPTGTFNSATTSTDGSGVIDFSILVADPDGDNTKAKLLYSAGSACSFAGWPPNITINPDDASTTAVYGDPKVDNASPYQLGTTTGWILTATASVPVSNTVWFDWSSNTDLPNTEGTYCVQLTTNDGSYDQLSSANQLVMVDNKNPSTPGQLTATTSSLGNGVVLTYGAPSTDLNFKEYKIFYKQGTSGVTENDLVWDQSDDINLATSTFNGAATTTINELQPRTAYVFNIWSYDQYGHKASSTEVTITTGKAAPVRANSVLFYGGQYTSPNGLSGQLTNVDNSLPAFNFSLAENGAKIRNAYIVFEAHFNSYVANATLNYTGYKLSFDACNNTPCTPNPSSGTGIVTKTDTTNLAYGKAGSSLVRLLLDVTNEAQIAAYTGNGAPMKGQLLYNFTYPSATSSISEAKYYMVVTYDYNSAATDSYTNTVIYPLESTAAGDSGTRHVTQAGSCVLDSSCPKFGYNITVPEIKQSLSQWFQTSLVNYTLTPLDTVVDVNIEGTNISSDSYIYEQSIGNGQSNSFPMMFGGVSGYQENTAQQLEYHVVNALAAPNFYLIGGEAVDTYTASTSATTKTRTVVYPIGVINNGLTTASSTAGVNVYFPENGTATGTVSIKKAWFRILSNDYNNTARNFNVQTQVGARASSTVINYAYRQSSLAPKPSFNVYHVIPAADYSTLESANTSSSTRVSITTKNSSATSQGGTSAELLITYTYVGEQLGHLTSLSLLAGQSYTNSTTTLATTTVTLALAPEPISNKTMLGGDLLSSYFLNANGNMNANATLLGANLSTSTPTCTNTYNTRPDSTTYNAFTDFYTNVSANLVPDNHQAYFACFSNDGGGSVTEGAKMNGIFNYIYKYDAPTVQYVQDNWRWYANADSLTPGSALSNENISLTNVNLADILRLRLNVGPSVENLAAANQAFKLQYGVGTSCAAIVSWTDVGTTTSSLPWRSFDNPSVLGGSSTGSILLSNSNKFETYEENNPSAVNAQGLNEGELGEWDWAVYNNNASSSQSYCFRMVKSIGGNLNVYNSYPIIVTAASNTAPINPTGVMQYLNASGTTTIPNQAWINQQTVRLVAQTNDVNINQAVSLYYQLATTSGGFISTTTVPGSACNSGTNYAACASKIWVATSTASDWRVTPFIGTTTINAIPQDYVGYKWQVLACDAASACSTWINMGAVPQFKVDITAPTPPGNMTATSVTANSVTLIFGASSTETNFDRYKIFYKKSTTTVSENDTEYKNDSILLFQNYAGATSTIINSLSAGTNYTFNIWAYDAAGNKASSTIVKATTSSSFTPPSGVLGTVGQRTDGTGGIDIIFTADDPDNDDTLRAKIEYEAGASCAFTTATKTTMDTLDASTYAYTHGTFILAGDPKVDNTANYRVGTSTGWIMTSPGASDVFTNWLSKTDLPGANGQYCVRLTVNDGIFDSTSTSKQVVTIDNLAPTTPGNLTLNHKNANSLTLNYGTPSTDTHSVRYRIFYSTSSPVNELAVEQLDGNLAYQNFNNVGTTTITGLLASTTYYINIWAYDSYGNNASGTQVVLTTNSAPFAASSTKQIIGTSSIVSNGGWISTSTLALTGQVNDTNNPEILTLYFEFRTDGSSFATATSVPANACAAGISYGACASKVWYSTTSASSSWAVTPFVSTTTITGIPDSATGYDWQLIGCDDDGDCSSWSKYSTTTPNVMVDTQAPVWTGSGISINSWTSGSVTLNLDNQANDTNFDHYRIFYSTTSPTTENPSMEYVDPDLNAIDYNGTAMMTVQNLDPATTYYFNIWAYDAAGNKASSSEISRTTSVAQSTPGVFFFTTGSNILYYKLWSGSGWSTTTKAGPAFNANIRQIESLPSDDRGKVALLVKTWTGTVQTWAATVYKYSADSFTATTTLGSALTSANTNNLMNGCIGSLSGGDFFIVRNNNSAAALTANAKVYSWTPSTPNAWTVQTDIPSFTTLLNGCRLIRRPNTDNYVLLTYDSTTGLAAPLRVGYAYYVGSSTYTNNWTNWSSQSASSYNYQNYVGEGFIDASNNTRGVFNYNTSTSTYTYGRNIYIDNTTINNGSASTTYQTAPYSWSGAVVNGLFSADPGSAGIAYFVGSDVNNQLNVNRIDISTNPPTWSTTTNGDNVSASSTYSQANFSERPYDLAYYKFFNALLVYNLAGTNTPRYRVINGLTNTVDVASSTVPGATSSIRSRVKLYKDPNENQLLAAYQNGNTHSAIFWNGANNSFFSAGNQKWTDIATGTTIFSLNDKANTFSFTSANSAPNTPTNLVQYRADATTTLANGAWATSSTVYLGGSATDPDTNGTLTLYVQLSTTSANFISSTTEPVGACVWGTAFASCTSTVWFVASSSPGDYSFTPYTNKININNVPNSATGYSWQLIACDDKHACSNWVNYNASEPNFLVDAIAPTNPSIGIASRNSNSITLSYLATTTETNFSTYKIFFKASSSGVTESDSQWVDANLGYINYNNATSTNVSGLASSTLYYFKIWAYDMAGNKASSTEISTTTVTGPILAQTSYIFENDDGANANSNSTSTLASTTLNNVNIGQRINARLQLENSGGDSAISKIYKLQFENQTDAPGTWVDVSNTSQIAFGLGLSGSNADAITGAKAAANAGKTWVNGTWHEGVGTTNAYTLAKNSYTEFVFALRTYNALVGKTYRLRLYNQTNGSTLDAYNNYPTINTVNNDLRRYSKGAYASLYGTQADLSYYFDFKGYNDAATSSDSNRDFISATANYPVENFVIRNSNNTQSATGTWRGQTTVAASVAPVYLQIFRAGGVNAWITVASNTVASANTDFVLSGFINSKLAEYYDAQNATYWRVYQDPGTEILKSDYFALTYSTSTPDVTQKHYRWRNDNGSETTATWGVAEDTGTSTAKNANIRLRMSVADLAAGAANNYRYQLEYATSSAGDCLTDPGNWTTVLATGTRAFKMATTSNVTDQATTSKQLANTEAYIFTSGRIVSSSSNATASTTLSEGQYTENEYVIQATNYSVTANTYCFRMTASGTPLDHYNLLAPITISGSANLAPTFVGYPDDGGSATSTPTDLGTAVTFSAMASDTPTDNYYLAVCQTPGITPGTNYGAPTCTGGAWCYSALASSSATSTCDYVTATSSESLNWYAYACDAQPGVGIAKCSTVSSGSGSGADVDSPFVINHPPIFSSLSSTPTGDPGATFTFKATSSDPDVIGGGDTLDFYVCSTNSANSSGCDAGQEICHVTGAGPNPTCDFTDTAPTPAGPVTYYGFLFDNHQLPATNNSLTNTYSINNVPPILGSLVLNAGAPITLNPRGASDTVVQTVNTSVVDQNGCQTGLVTATAQIYYSNVAGGYSCVNNSNDCYQIGIANCVKTGCAGDSSPLATYTCTAQFKYFAKPTDNSSGNPFEPYNWVSRLQVFDGLTYVSTTSNAVELNTGQILDVTEPAINYGSNLFAGQNSGTTTQTTSIYNAGNAPIDTNLAGIDMSGNPSGTILVGNQHWNLSPGVSWSAGSALTNAGQDVSTNIPRATSTTGSFRPLYWGIGIPFGSNASAYTGSNSFNSLLWVAGWN